MYEGNDYNQRLHTYLDLLHHGTYKTCLFGVDCPNEVIRAHSVSKAVLSDLEHDRHVIQPGTKYVKDESGHSRPQFMFRSVGINKASTGTFVCRPHDDAFRPVDTTPIDVNDLRVLDLLFYRAILKEIWQLLRMQIALMWLERKGRLPGRLPTHPYTRLRSLLRLMGNLYELIELSSHSEGDRLVEHLVRKVKSDRPVVASSYASGGSDLGFDDQTGRELSPREVMAVLGHEPNSSWGFSVIPQAGEHLVVASWLKGSRAKAYFDHFEEVNGKELEAAVSAELIFFCENWFLHPKVWDSYGHKKRLAIETSYQNFMELQFGKYQWSDKSDKMTWYDFLDIGNRHQINLFRYNTSVFV